MFGKSCGKTLTTSFLVAGTCVGGGILGLPVESGSMGFGWALVVLLFSWAFMTLTALLYAEASLWMKEEGAHVVTIAKHLLGRTGEWIAVAFYVFMAYATLVAYNAGGSLLVHNIFQSAFDLALTQPISATIYACVFGSTLYLGVRLLGWLNALFVVCMIVAYLGLVTIGFQDLKLALLRHGNMSQIYIVLPLMITSFSFQMIVPSLALYVDHDKKVLTRSIVYGTSMAAIAYGLWLFVVLGIVPVDGEHGLAHALQEGKAATESLKFYTQSTFLPKFAEFFAFFAITTSYFGIALGLFDFLSDLTKIQKKGWGKLILGLLVFVPTLYGTISFPNAFLSALDVTGGLGDSILNGIIPVLMVWIGRYVIGYKDSYKLWGGRPLLVLLFLCSLLIITVQIFKFF